MTEGRYRLIGSTASPYAIKLRALMRYRRIPFDWVIMTKALRKATEHLRPNLIPVLQYPAGTFRGETTTLLRSGKPPRGTVPSYPTTRRVAFVCDLLEDLADEWAVKPLFLVSLVGSGGSDLCLALGRRGMVGVGGADRQCGGDRAVSSAADFTDGHPRCDR